MQNRPDVPFAARVSSKTKGDRSPQTRRGFSLIELLVVIAIIAVLVALLIPAVQQAREMARRTQCRSQLRQIALAINTYESTHKFLPINRYGDYGYTSVWGYAFEDSYSWSWLASILPQLDMNPAWVMANIPNVRLVDSPIIHNHIPLFICPSDVVYGPVNEKSNYLRTNPIVALTTYKGVQGANYCWGDWPNPGTNGHSCEPWEDGDGAIFPLNWLKPRAWTDFRDGISSTIVVGESSYNQESPGIGNFGLGWAWAHSVEACAVASFPINARHPDGSPYAATDWTNMNGFRSKHSGGAHFAFGDGSVKFLNENITLSTFRGMATLAGKEAIGDY